MARKNSAAQALDKAAEALQQASAAVQQAKGGLAPVHISVVLDRSGSMEKIRDDTIGGFNTFLKEQRDLETPPTISLHQFDTDYDTVYANRPAKEAPLLDRKTFVPRGGTALLDAVGRTINAASLVNGVRHVVVIITDGEENSSHEFNQLQIKSMIQAREGSGWQFIYLGANQDAFRVATNFGIPMSHTMSTSATKAGTSAMYNSLSASVRGYASGAAASTVFTADDIKLQEDAGAVKRTP